MTWSTVLISAGTSALVALLIEVTIKPYIDARKERIIEKRRAIRDVEAGLGRIVTLATIYSTDTPHRLSNEARGRFNEEMRRYRASILDDTRHLEGILLKQAMYLTEPERQLLSGFVGRVRGILMSDRQRQEIAIEIVALGSPVADSFIGGRRLRRLGRSRRIRRQLGAA